MNAENSKSWPFVDATVKASLEHNAQNKDLFCEILHGVEVGASDNDAVQGVIDAAEQSPYMRGMMHGARTSGAIAAITAERLFAAALRYGATKGDNDASNDEKLEKLSDLLPAIDAEIRDDAKNDLGAIAQSHGLLAGGDAGNDPVDPSLVAALRSSDWLRAIIREAGAMRGAVNARKRKTISNRALIQRGVTIGGEIDRLTDFESMLIAASRQPGILPEKMQKAVRMMQAHKLATETAQVARMIGKDPKESGNFTMIVDGSGSMFMGDGWRAKVALASAIVAAQRCIYERRTMRLMLFDVTVREWEISQPSDLASFMRDLAGIRNGGMTKFRPVVSRLLASADKIDDVVIITDGEFDDGSPSQGAEFLERAKRDGATVFGTAINCHSRQLDWYCDHVEKVDTYQQFIDNMTLNVASAT